MPVHGLKNRRAVEDFLEGREAVGGTMSARNTNAGLTLFSFEEPIAVLKSDRELLVELDWKYSLTTRSHRRLLCEVADGRYELTNVTREQIRGLAGLDPTAPAPLIPNAWGRR